MQGAIVVMRNAQWIAGNQDLVIRAEASGTSLADALEWQEEEGRKAEKRKRAAAEKQRKIDEMLKGMSPSDRSGSRGCSSSWPRLASRPGQTSREKTSFESSRPVVEPEPGPPGRRRSRRPAPPPSPGAAPAGRCARPRAQARVQAQGQDRVLRGGRDGSITSPPPGGRLRAAPWAGASAAR